MSGFPIKKTLEDFDFSFQPSIDKRQIEELATMRFRETERISSFSARPAWAKPIWLRRLAYGCRQASILHLLHQLPHPN